MNVHFCLMLGSTQMHDEYVLDDTKIWGPLEPRLAVDMSSSALYASKPEPVSAL